MTYDLALVSAQTLREALLDHGVRAVSIELQRGREFRDGEYQWFNDRFIGVLGHHTVSKPSDGDTPCLWLVKNGRADLPGPLSNNYGGYDRIARLISRGWANHPGEGGPLTLPGGTIPKDNGRAYLDGWEFEGGLEDWTDEMHEFMARCLAGNLDYHGLSTASQGEHKTWAPTRKIDRLGYTTQSGRDATAQYMGGGEEDMSQADVDAIKRELATVRSVAEATYNKANAAMVYAQQAAKLAGVSTQVIKSKDHPAQFALIGGTLLWIKDQDDVDAWGLRDIGFEEIANDDTRWNTPLQPPAPEDFPAGILRIAGE